MGKFRWSSRKEEAAVLAAEDRLSNEEIAAKVGASRGALIQWKRHPEFVARMASHLEALRAAVLDRGISDRANRVAALEDRWRRMNMVIDARAEEMAALPGGKSGLLVRQAKLVKLYAPGSRGRLAAGRQTGAGDDGAGEQLPLPLGEGRGEGSLPVQLPAPAPARGPEQEESLGPVRGAVLVEELAVDIGLLRELRETEKQVAQELGQWVERRDQSGDLLVREYVGIEVEIV